MRVKTQYALSSKAEISVSFDDCYQMTRIQHVADVDYYDFVQQLFRELANHKSTDNFKFRPRDAEL